MTGSVLCAVDVHDGEDGVKTIKAAAGMATLYDAQLDVVAVVPDYGMSQIGAFFSKDHHEEMVAETKDRLNDLVVAALDAEQNSKVRHLVATGRAYEEVLNLAKAAKSDLIVIGAHKPDFADYLLGPNAARVVRHANCSVFVVR